MKSEFENLIEKLIELGEDTDELSFWQSIYDDLSEKEQQELLKILTAEIQSLEDKKS